MHNWISLINIIIGFISGIILTICGFVLNWWISQKDLKSRESIADREISIRLLEKRLEIIYGFMKRLHKLSKEFFDSTAKDLKEKNKINEWRIKEILDLITLLFLETAPYLDERAIKNIGDNIKPLAETFDNKGIGIQSDVSEKLWEKVPGSAEQDAKVKKLLREIFHIETESQDDHVEKHSEWGIDTGYDVFRAMTGLVNTFDGILFEQYETIIMQLHSKKKKNSL